MRFYTTHRLQLSYITSKASAVDYKSYSMPIEASRTRLLSCNSMIYKHWLRATMSTVPVLIDLLIFTTLNTNLLFCFEFDLISSEDTPGKQNSLSKFVVFTFVELTLELNVMTSTGSPRDLHDCDSQFLKKEEEIE